MAKELNQTPDAALDVEEVMKKYDRESNTRIWQGAPKYIVEGIQVCFALFCIYVTLFATWLDQVRLTSFVGLIVLMGYLNYPVKKGEQRVNHIPWYDWIIMLAGSGAFFYFCFSAEPIIMRLPTIQTYEVIIGLVGLLALIELCRRAVGIPILCVAGFFILYALYYFIFQKQLGFVGAIRTLVYRLFYTTTGILSTPVNVCAKFIVVFIIFGAFLERTGISEFFISLANSVAGAASGGPAKVAVISSALCGMVSGSSVGNTVTTGSVTIPMMKKTGYKPEFAGAVEAAASTGGQIMPPIMGAAAFLMADYVGVPYSNIIVRAILPAVLYFLGIFICVHLEAKKLGLKGISRDLLPKFKDLVKRTYLLLPLIILIYLVSSNSKTMAFSAAVAILFAIGVSNMHKSPLLAALGCVLLLVYLFAPLPTVLGIIVLIAGIALCLVCMFLKGSMLTPMRCFDALAAGGKGCISVATACGIAGVIAGCITMTGLASKLISSIISLTSSVLAVSVFLSAILGVLVFVVIYLAIRNTSGKNALGLVIGLVAAVGVCVALVSTNAVYSAAGAMGVNWKGCEIFLALFLTMLCCIVLGMGVPTTANYCIMASTCAPILIQMGIPAMASHFFVFYFGIVADITPPVALAAYAGSAIAKSKPMNTALNATKLAIAAFIVPYIFAMNPQMLLIDASAWDVILNTVTAILGIYGVAGGLEGYLVLDCNWVVRIVSIVAGLLMLIPGLVTDLIGIVVLGGIILFQFIKKKNLK